MKRSVTKKVLDAVLSLTASEAGHSVLEQIYTKDPYPDQRLPQHESQYPIGLKSASIEITHIVSKYIDLSKTDFY